MESLTDETAEQFYALGYAQYACGNWAKAAKAFSILCNQRPLESRFWFSLSATLQESGEYEGALNAWAMTALLDKENPYPHFHAAECALSAKKEGDAKLALREAERLLTKEHPLRERIALLKQIWEVAS